MRKIKRLLLLCLLSSALAQVQTTGTVTLTGSAQVMPGGKHSVNLAWKATPGQYISYRIYRSTSSGSGYTMVGSLITTLSYTDSTVTDSTTYYYVATAYDSSTKSESAYSNEISATIP